MFWTPTTRFLVREIPRLTRTTLARILLQFQATADGVLVLEEENQVLSEWLLTTERFPRATRC